MEEIAKVNINNLNAYRRLKKLNYILKLVCKCLIIERKIVANSLLGRLKNETFLDRIVTKNRLCMTIRNTKNLERVK